MGIPCYFVSLIRKYPELMVDFERKQGPVDVLYLDSNSIVYDALRDMDVTKEDADGSVIEAVMAKLDEYISTFPCVSFGFVRSHWARNKAIINLEQF